MRRKLLDLCYANAAKEQQLSAQLDAVKADDADVEQAARQNDELSRRFEQDVATLTDLDIAALRDAATKPEKRVCHRSLRSSRRSRCSPTSSRSPSQVPTPVRDA